VVRKVISLMHKKKYTAFTKFCLLFFHFILKLFYLFSFHLPKPTLHHVFIDLQLRNNSVTDAAVCFLISRLTEEVKIELEIYNLIFLISAPPL
jgi:hypothetical protein